MRPVADVPILAIPGGSIVQFLLMTLPLLCVYLYFLWLAIDRKNIANPNDPRYPEDRIRLTDILYTYLATLVLFASLAVYLLWFVKKRRKLSKRYEEEAIVILGNVEYDESHWEVSDSCWKNVASFLRNGLTRRNDYGKVVYDLERVANHPACDYEARRRGKKELSGTVSKTVRVFYRYPREQVSVLVLPSLPYSGQPKIDMEADWASFSTHVGLPSEHGGEGEEADAAAANLPRTLSRDRSLGVLLVAAFWIAFLLLGSLYVVFQVGVVEDYYEDETARVAWIIFWSFVGGGIPIVAIGGNWLRWKAYERWILTSGTKRKNKKKKSKPQIFENEENDDGTGYIQMT